ncbi:binary toxin-like calcium binding domain-containing protein, partial [Bacillus cereus]
MQLKSIYKCLTITALLAHIAVFPSSSVAEEAKTKKSSTPKTEQQQKNQRADVGLVGYYFVDDQFNESAFVQTGEKGKLLDAKKVKQDTSQIKSIRWEGNIKPSKTGEYILSTSSNKHVTMKINGETIIKQADMEKAMKLEKEKNYSITIEYHVPESGKDLQLFWEMSGEEKVQIPDNNILSPNFSETNQLQSRSGQQQSTSGDFDGDGIPDSLEENGYTFKDAAIVPWKDEYTSQGYKKYTSNSRKAKTSADPYTDFEKVIGRMPEATKREARDPLVAAYPSVGVGMEKFHFSKNENVQEGASGTKTKTVTDTSTTTHSVDIGGSFGWGDKGPSFTFSPKYTHSWSNSTSVANSESDTWSSQIGTNPSEAAYLNANVRYYNGGNAPIYDLRPTSNFVLQNSSESIATITANANTIGNSLGPSATYPAKGQAPISLTQANEAGTIKISVNSETLDKIQEGTETLNIETTQNRGQYGKIDEEGNQIPGGEWDPIRTNIDAVSGALTLNLGSGKENLERRVAAKDLRDPEDKTPELTIKEAIKKAFD